MTLTNIPILQRTSHMEPQKLAVVGVTLVVVTVGLLIGAAFMTFPTGDAGGGNDPLTRYTTNQDLLELALSAPSGWSFEMSDDTTLLLSDLRGQVVLVDLMATWCSTCKIQDEFLETVNENLAGTVVVLSLSGDLGYDNTASMAKHVIDYGLSWAHGLDTDYSFSNYFNVGAFPSMVLIDADGVFRYFHVGLWSTASITDTIASIL